MSEPQANLPEEQKFISTLDGGEMSYARIKELVCSSGWTSCTSKITPVTLERAFDVSYNDAFAVARRLVADGILVEAGLHEWRYAP